MVLQPAELIAMSEEQASYTAREPEPPILGAPIEGENIPQASPPEIVSTVPATDPPVMFSAYDDAIAEAASE